MGGTGPLDAADCINEVCPWSGKPVAADSLTLYRGSVVGFCNPGCRDKFEKASAMFEEALSKIGIAGRAGPQTPRGEE